MFRMFPCQYGQTKMWCCLLALFVHLMPCHVLFESCFKSLRFLLTLFIFDT